MSKITRGVSAFIEKRSKIPSYSFYQNISVPHNVILILKIYPNKNLFWRATGIICPLVNSTFPSERKKVRT